MTTLRVFPSWWGDPPMPGRSVMHWATYGHDRELFQPLAYGFPGPQPVPTIRWLDARGQGAASRQFIAQTADRDIQQPGDLCVGVTQLFCARMFCRHIETPFANFRLPIGPDG